MHAPLVRMLIPRAAQSSRLQLEQLPLWLQLGAGASMTMLWNRSQSGGGVTPPLSCAQSGRISALPPMLGWFIRSCRNGHFRKAELTFADRKELLAADVTPSATTAVGTGAHGGAIKSSAVRPDERPGESPGEKPGWKRGSAQTFSSETPCSSVSGSRSKSIWGSTG